MDRLKKAFSAIGYTGKDYVTQISTALSTIIIACFLISTFETENPRKQAVSETTLLLFEQEKFNEFWDDTYGEFEMGEYSYQASEILYNVDYDVYKTEYKNFTESEVGEKNNAT